MSIDYKRSFCITAHEKPRTPYPQFIDIFFGSEGLVEESESSSWNCTAKVFPARAAVQPKNELSTIGFGVREGIIVCAVPQSFVGHDTKLCSTRGAWLESPDQEILAVENLPTASEVSTDRPVTR